MVRWRGFRGGGRLERDLVAHVTEVVCRRYLGLLRTHAQVKAAIQAGVAEAIQEIKNDTLRLA